MAYGGHEMAIQFKPDEDNTQMLRNAFSRFISGVTIVTTASNQGPVGITANSFSSLSLNPPLVLWSPAIDSRRFTFFEQAEYFAIHILAANQEYICNNFLKSPFAFEETVTKRNIHNVPLIENCLARFECKKSAIYPGGDHIIVVGEVGNVEIGDGSALTFFLGVFASLASDERNFGHSATLGTYEQFCALVRARSWHRCNCCDGICNIDTGIFQIRLEQCITLAR
jgi:flavin reductase (DIM6/NTAB) family NADH-FMN oxidoreductase RutF